MREEICYCNNTSAIGPGKQDDISKTVAMNRAGVFASAAAIGGQSNVGIMNAKCGRVTGKIPSGHRHIGSGLQAVIGWQNRRHS